MRNLLARLILWLARRLDINLIDEARIRMGPDKVARSQRWEAFANEDGGLFDMIEHERRVAFEAYSACPPDARAERDYLAMTDRNWRTLKQRIAGVIVEGKIEQRNADAKRQVRIVKSV